MAKCKFSLFVLAFFGGFGYIFSCPVFQRTGFCQNYEEPRRLFEIVLLNEEGDFGIHKIARSEGEWRRPKDELSGNSGVAEARNKYFQELKTVESEPRKANTQKRLRKYFTNLDPSDCRINLLRRQKIGMPKRSVRLMESYERLTQLLGILSSKRPCPYCKGCQDQRLDSLPIWVSPILHRQIKKINSQLDNKLCLILKKDSRLSLGIREILTLSKDGEKAPEPGSIFSGEIFSDLHKMMKSGRQDDPLTLLGVVLELIFDELRNASIKLSSCSPSQFLFKCSWHPNRQNLEILAKLTAVSESMLRVSRDMDFESEPTSNGEKNFRITFGSSIRDSRGEDETSILCKDILKVPTTLGPFSSSFLANSGLNLSSSSYASSSHSSSTRHSSSSYPSPSHLSHSSTAFSSSVSSSSSRSSHPGYSALSTTKQCGSPFFDSMVMLREDGSQNTGLDMCGFGMSQFRPTGLSESEELELESRFGREERADEGTKLKVIQGVPYVSKFAALHYDYASSSSNSKLLAWSEGVLRPKSVQSSNPDSYLLVPCSKPMWFIIGFQEDIFLEYIALFSLEYFSSSFREIEISGSLVYPEKQWVPIGILRRNERLSKEMFDLKLLCGKQERMNSDILEFGLEDHGAKGRSSDLKEEGTNRSAKTDLRSGRDFESTELRKDSVVGGSPNIKEGHISMQNTNPCWVRYIKIRAISYYEEGHYYCHLNRIQIFGNNVINKLEVEMGGDRRSSISISDTEESVKDVENRLWDREVEGVHGTIANEKPQILHLNSSGFGIIGRQLGVNVEEAARLEGRNLLVRNPEKISFEKKREMYDNGIGDSGNYRPNISKGHPLLSLIDRVKVLEKQLEAFKFEERLMFSEFNSSISLIGDSVRQLSDSVKYLQEIFLDSNSSDTGIPSDGPGNQFGSFGSGNTDRNQVFVLVNSVIERLVGKRNAESVWGQLFSAGERFGILLSYLVEQTLKHLFGLAVLSLFVISFIIQAILFRKYLSLKRRLHNSLQFFKSYSNSHSSPRNSLLIDEAFYFQKNLKLHSNPVTNSFKGVGGGVSGNSSRVEELLKTRVVMLNGNSVLQGVEKPNESTRQESENSQESLEKISSVKVKQESPRDYQKECPSGTGQIQKPESSPKGFSGLTDS
ncbi:SUN/Galactose-binding domain containing protein [Cryptosporidium felis]|nr:SUN/Galactose-binding domain containing protein [Cryptosporidium felis]